MTKTKQLGRPRTIKGSPMTVNLDELTRALAAKLGNGNASAGLRAAVLIASGAASSPPSQQPVAPAFPMPAPPAQPRLYPDPPAQHTPYPPVAYLLPDDPRSDQ